MIVEWNYGETKPNKRAAAIVTELLSSSGEVMKPSDFGANYSTLLIRKGDEIRAGVILHAYSGWDLSVSIAAVNARWATPLVLGRLAHVIFNELHCIRCSTMCAADNYKLVQFNERLGFRQEGIVRKGMDGERDACLFGMLKDECYWLKYYGKETKRIKTH